MNIKAVSFDLDDTLWPILPVILKAEELTNTWLINNYPAVKNLLNTGEMTGIRNKLIFERRDLVYHLSELRKLSLVELGIRSGYTKSESQNMAEESFKIFFSSRNQVTLYEGVKECLIKLKEKYSLGVVTNGNADLEEIGINHYFDFDFSAEEIKAGKPDPKIFKAVIEKTGLNSKEICHVGDHPVNDVMGSLDVGMHAIWFNKKQDEWPLDKGLNFREISSWYELEDVLEEIS